MIRAAVISALLVVSAHAAVDVDRLVDALREREGYRGRPGALGEQGPWQLMPATWMQHMPGVPFAVAREESAARACALKHVRWLQAQLQARGVDASVFNLAAAWNAGLTRYLSGAAPVRAYRFAADVAAIYARSLAHEHAEANEGVQHALGGRRSLEVKSFARRQEQPIFRVGAPKADAVGVVGRFVLRGPHRHILHRRARKDQDPAGAELQGVWQRFDEAVAGHVATLPPN